MKIPKDISDNIRIHLENEIESGRRMVSLSQDVVKAFLDAPEGRELKPAAVRPASVPSLQIKEESESKYKSERDKPFLETLEDISKAVASCTLCRLCKSRTNTVPGAGNGVRPDILFIGEGPGRDEDEQGIPFVGRAGKLLTKMIDAMGYTREEVFIANVVKCRPPDNRAPSADEMAACLPWLLRQIEILNPKTIVTLGATALKGLTGRDDLMISKERGVWNKFKEIPLMPTFHPSYLLRFSSAKVQVWKDLRAVMKFLGKPVKQKQNDKV